MFCYLFAFMFSFHCALTFHYESRVLTLPPKSPIGNVGLGSALQNKSWCKERLWFIVLLFCFLFLGVLGVLRIFYLLFPISYFLFPN